MREDELEIGSTFRKDFLWYFLGSLVPMLISFVKTPIFTRHFNEESFGQLGLVTISFSFFGMMLFSWINSCIWRYYSKYQGRGQLTNLYSNLFALFIISLFVLSLVCLGWYWVAKEELTKQLILLCYFQLIFNQLFMAYMVVIRLMGKSRYYTFVQAAKAFFGLTLALVFVFYFDWGISALVASLAIVDLCLLLILLPSNKALLQINFKSVDTLILKDLLRYGTAGLLLNLSILSISYSDRYIIALFYTQNEVGIYDQVAKISQLSVMALITIYFNTINPVLIKRLELDFAGSLKLMQSFVFAFVFIGLPIIFYLSLFSEEVATLLLGMNFRKGYVMMPYFFTASFLYGLTSFFELRLKFSDKIRKLGIIAIVIASLNILLNVVLVPMFAYTWAAYTTLLSYAIMLSILFYGDREVLSILKEKWKTLTRLFLFLTIQYAVYVVLVDMMNLQSESRIGVGIVFAVLFLLVFRKTITELKLSIN